MENQIRRFIVSGIHYAQRQIPRNPNCAGRRTTLLQAQHDSHITKLRTKKRAALHSQSAKSPNALHSHLTKLANDANQVIG
jgi:hypothetical protein